MGINCVHILLKYNGVHCVYMYVNHYAAGRAEVAILQANFNTKGQSAY